MRIWKRFDKFVTLLNSSTVIQLQLSQMDLYVFSSTDQIQPTILQEPSRSHGTIISSPGPFGLLILTPI